MWSEDAIATLDGNNGHAAYLGYLNFLLGLQRLADPTMAQTVLHDRISAALDRRLLARPIGLLETYPSEVYPVDNAFVAGSLGLHETITGTSHRNALDHWEKLMKSKYIDPASGLLIQSVNTTDGSGIDAPRGSGTSLALWPIHHAAPDLSAKLYAAVHLHLHEELFGFGGMREYLRGHDGWGDIDSGPIIGGIGLSASGFTLSGARMHGDKQTFQCLFASANLFGAPVNNGNARYFISGGALGNAIMFAMLTAPPGKGLVPR